MAWLRTVDSGFRSPSTKCRIASQAAASPAVSPAGRTLQQVGIGTEFPDQIELAAAGEEVLRQAEPRACG